MLEKESIDVVLCGVKLPDGPGVKFVQTAKQKLPVAGKYAPDITLRNDLMQTILKDDTNKKELKIQPLKCSFGT